MATAEDTNIQKIIHLAVEQTDSLHIFQGPFEYEWGNFSFSQNNKSNLFKFKVIKR